MAYASQQNMVDRFGERELVGLTDRDGSTGVIVADVLAQALADADDEINVYLAARYSLPLASSPGALIRIACDIARYRLYDDAAPDTVAQRYQAAVKFLQAVARGTLTFGPAADGGQPQTSNEAEIGSAGRIWSRSDHGFL